MIGDLFDSPWKILIVAVVIIVLFGSKKLPDAARSLGKSMRILKTEVGSMHEDEPAADAKPAAPFTQPELTPAPVPAPAHQDQIDALQQQVRDLQRAATMDTPAPAGAVSEPQHTQQPS
jgi:sec-independent protein translocase protein TatA